MWRPLLIAIASVAACAEPMPDRLALPQESRYPYDDCDLAWMTFEIQPASRDHVVLTFDPATTPVPRIGQRWSDTVQIVRTKRFTNVRDDGTFDADARRDAATGRVVGEVPPGRAYNAQTLSPDRRYRLDGPHNNVVRAIALGSDREVFRAAVDPCLNVRSAHGFRDVVAELGWLDDVTPLMFTSVEMGDDTWPVRLDVWDLNSGRIRFSSGEIEAMWGPWLLRKYSTTVVHVQTGATIAAPDEIRAVANNGSWVAGYHSHRETLWFLSRDGRGWQLRCTEPWRIAISPHGRYASWRMPDGDVFLDLERGLLHGVSRALDQINPKPKPRPDPMRPVRRRAR